MGAEQNRARRLAETFRQVGRSAGYFVCTWDAVENGDPADSYFWRANGGGADQSEGTFDTEEAAWRDCCESNGLLDTYLSMIASAGSRIVRPDGFLLWHWDAGQGTRSDPFLHWSEAVLDWALTFELQDRPASGTDAHQFPGMTI